MTSVRPPAVAGLFYPDDPRELRASVDALLAETPRSSQHAARALVVPHAGYVYSGPIAAQAYARIAPTVNRVIILGPAHRVPVEGLAVPTVDAFRTPLGDVPIDAQARDRALALPGVTADDRAHADEHAIEVHLPFLQCVLGDFTIVPFVVGHAAPSVVGDVIDALWDDEDTLVLVSSDLSHYESYTAAAAHDHATADAIVKGDADGLGPYDACGVYPLRGLLRVAQQRALVSECIDLRSSGDTAGDRKRVVGYGAFALSPS